MTSYSSDTKIPCVVRVAFAHGLFVPQKNQRGIEQWTCSLLMPKTENMSAVTGAVLEAATAEWGDKAKGWLESGLIKSPILDGDGKQGLSKKTGERHEGFAGHWFIRSASGIDHRPAVFSPTLSAITDKAQFQSGVYANVVVYAYTWENSEQGKGVSVTARMFQKVRDSEKPLGGGGGSASPDSFFEKIDDAGAAPDSTKSGDGAAGLFG